MAIVCKWKDQPTALWHRTKQPLAFNSGQRLGHLGLGRFAKDGVRHRCTFAKEPGVVGLGLRVDKFVGVWAQRNGKRLDGGGAVASARCTFSSFLAFMGRHYHGFRTLAEPSPWFMTERFNQS